MPIAFAHYPHRAHLDKLRDSRRSGVLAKLPRVALPQCNYTAPALALRVAGSGFMTAEAACGIASPRRVGRAPAAHTFGVLLTPKVHCTGLLDARRRHTEIGQATHATVVEVA